MNMVYAGFWRRFVAHWVDSAILNLAAMIFVPLYLASQGLSASDLKGLQLQILSTGAYACFGFAYYSAAHYRWGYTLGKRLLGVRVVDAQTGSMISAGQSIGRTLAYLLSYAIFGLGFLMAAWDGQRRALHDRICSTVSIRMT